jgi:hypothetical protein
MAVSGVRSSCEVFATKARNRSKEASRRASVSLKTVAMRPNSSSGFPTGSRSESDSAVISRAFDAIALMGESARPARKYPPAIESNAAHGKLNSRTASRERSVPVRNVVSSATVTLRARPLTHRGAALSL